MRSLSPSRAKKLTSAAWRRRTFSWSLFRNAHLDRLNQQRERSGLWLRGVTADDDNQPYAWPMRSHFQQLPDHRRDQDGGSRRRHASPGPEPLTTIVVPSIALPSMPHFRPASWLNHSYWPPRSSALLEDRRLTLGDRAGRRRW
jgi:hypothetical protein